MGSAADLNYGADLALLARRCGAAVAQTGNLLVFGAEKDYSSLSTEAALGAREVGGLTLGVTYGKTRDIFVPESASFVVPCGAERGGGREFTLVMSCDGVIALGGGSGTLTEMAMAYQANRPIVVLEGSGGWSDLLAETFIDRRERVLIRKAATPEACVELLLNLLNA